MRRGPRLLLAAAIAAGALYVAVFRGLETAPLSLGDAERRPLADGLEVVEARLWRGWSVASRLVVIYADPTRYEAALLINSDQAPLADLEREKPLVVNAGYFTPERKPTGLLVSQGKVLSPFIPEGGAAGSGVLVVQDDLITLLERERVGRRLFTGASLAIQAGPRVIEPGGHPGIRNDDGARANRTIIGVDGRGWLVIAAAYASDGGLAAGPSLFELQSVLGEQGLGQTATELALTAALNLDGGPSTGLYLRHPERTLELPEVGRAHSVLTLRAR